PKRERQSPRLLHRRPGPEADPGLAVEQVAVDGDAAGSQRIDHALAEIAEAALLDHPARARIDDAARGVEFVDVARPEGEVDHGVGGLGSVALAPVRLADPVADLQPASL